MKTQTNFPLLFISRRSVRGLLMATAFIVCFVVLHAHAQFFPGQFGGSSSRRSSSSSSSRQYPVNGTVGDAVFSVDPETRQLIVIADDETAEEIARVVANLDQPKPQVLIKVVFMEVTHKDSSDIGIEGSWVKNMGNSTTGMITHSFGLDGVGAVPPGAGLYQIFAQEYQVTLRAIATAGKAKVLSRPSIIARNNQPATINVGQSVPLITGTRFDSLTGNAINTYTYEDVGIILNVTPFITTDGMVEMVVSPEISDLEADRSQWVPISTSQDGTVISAPIINSRTADTVVVTPDGQTVIIGGLMRTAKADGESKIPVLGDIPLLGNLFKRKIKSDSRTELLIFLTPHIIQAPSELAAVSEREENNSRMSESFTEKELNEILDRIPSAEPPGAADAENSGSKRRKN